MERLTERLDGDGLCYGKVDCEDNCTYCERFLKVLDKLADYEDAEEQGLLLRLPCKVGDTVYVLKFEGVWRIVPHQVKTLGYVLQLIENEAIDDFAFLTREEAEKALEDMKGGKE